MTTAPCDQEQASLGSHLCGSLAGLQLEVVVETARVKRRLLRTQPPPLGSLCPTGGTVWLRIPSHLAEVCVTALALCGTGRRDLKLLELPLECKLLKLELGLFLPKLSQ